MSPTHRLVDIPLAYRLFFLYIEPISATLGAIYACAMPTQYLTDLTSSPASAALAQTPPTATLISLYQLANLYLFVALNEHLVLSSTTSLRTWRRLLFCLLVADVGHFATMVPLVQEKGGAELLVRFWTWSLMEWASFGFVYVAAALRCSFLAGIGLAKEARKQE